VRVYLDSSVVIPHVSAESPERAEMAAQLRRRLDARDQLVASDLTRMECRVRPLRERDAALVAAYDRFFEGTEVALEPVPREAWDRAAEVRARSGLKTPDALHVACAVTLGCDVLLTADARLARSGEIETELVAVWPSRAGEASAPLEIDKLTPLEALVRLEELKKLLEGD
jgi:predicted nucleic acid-binding protein